MGLIGTSIRLPKELLETIDEMGKRESRSRSNMIIALLREALDARATFAAHAEDWAERETEQTGQW
jgi:metal-responsive CopG/Arc/MetJ family transcriptional regulator